MLHRGPDDSGEWFSDDGKVGLGHRRLAILDLSPNGRQPMRNDAEDLVIVFNGEIYNHHELRKELAAQGHVFRSHSDTEVLLAAYTAWDEGCLSRLNGMFAFAICDTRQRRLFLARDRAGEKPLYYRHSAATLEFASELKALLARPGSSRRIDLVSLDCYLAMGFVPGGRCILDGYSKLPPGNALNFDLCTGKVRIWRYWSVPDCQATAEPEGRHEDELLQELESVLESAVGQQLIADVPVGILLSGGVDSSLVTALAVRRSPNVRTFTIGFPGHGQTDETHHARLIARHFKTEHTELMAGPTTADLMPRLAQQFDEPMADSSMIPTWLVTNLVRQYCTVALGGDGGDELFGGYPHYTRLLWLQQRMAHVPVWIRRLAAQTAERCLPLGFGGGNIRTWLMAAGEDLDRDLPMIAGHFDAWSRRQLISHGSRSGQAAEDIRRKYLPLQTDLLQRATRMDFGEYLTEDILVKVDRASMMNSLEVRAPFLDRRVIEFAFERVPSRLKATASDRKILLRRLASRILPREFNSQRKQGFSIPLADWLKSGPFRELFQDTLTSAGCPFNRHVVAHLLERQGRTNNNAERLFALVLFELWRQRYGIAL